MSRAADFNTRLVVLLVAVEAVSAIYLWTLNVVDNANGQLYAFYLAVVLITFAMISYIYRSNRLGRVADRKYLSVGCVIVILLLIFSMLPVN